MHILNEYIQTPIAERQHHLKLDTPCVDRGGNSTVHKGVLAQYLDTDIPSGMKIQLCHACHNGACSNPNHLYWGTPSENKADAVANGAFSSPWEASVAKYGLAEASRMNARGDKAKGGKAGKGKVLTAEHKKNISDGVIANYRNKE